MTASPFACRLSTTPKYSTISTTTFSNWIVYFIYLFTVRGGIGMPHFSWLEPTTCDWNYLYKYDTTISEIVGKPIASDKQYSWCRMVNHMNVNCKKRNSWFLDHLVILLVMTEKPVEWVSEYKLLCMTINASLKWDHHGSRMLSRLKQAWHTSLTKEQLKRLEDPMPCTRDYCWQHPLWNSMFYV